MSEAMTIQEHFDRYGAIDIIDKKDGKVQRAFVSRPETKTIGGTIRAGDIKRHGLF